MTRIVTPLLRLFLLSLALSFLSMIVLIIQLKKLTYPTGISGYPITGHVQPKVAPVTVVTAFYDIPSKRSSEIYREWIRYFLTSIPSYMYIYTQQSYGRFLTRQRLQFADRTKIIVKPFSELQMARK